MTRDLRMLTLYKQHYLDSYDPENPMESDFSCWGYYDGMDIRKVDQTRSRLYTKTSQSPVSELWYASVEAARKLTGYRAFPVF